MHPLFVTKKSLKYAYFNKVTLESDSFLDSFPHQFTWPRRLPVPGLGGGAVWTVFVVPVLEADHGFSRPHLPLVQLYIKESKNAILFDAIDDGMIRNARCLSRHRGHYSFLQIFCTWFFVNGNKLLKLSYRIREAGPHNSQDHHRNGSSAVWSGKLALHENKQSPRSYQAAEKAWIHETRIRPWRKGLFCCNAVFFPLLCVRDGIDRGANNWVQLPPHSTYGVTFSSCACIPEVVLLSNIFNRSIAAFGLPRSFLCVNLNAFLRRLNSVLF